MENNDTPPRTQDTETQPEDQSHIPTFAHLYPAIPLDSYPPLPESLDLEKVNIRDIPSNFPEIELPRNFKGAHVQNEMYAQMVRLNSVFHTILGEINPVRDIYKAPQKYAVAMKAQEQYLKTVRVLQNLHMVATGNIPADHHYPSLDKEISDLDDATLDS